MKFSVITYIFNDYEILHEIVNKEEDVEYVAVTDNPELTSDTWTVIFDPRLLGMSPFDKTFFVRYHPFSYVSTDVCIVLDGSMRINGNLQEIIDRFNSGNSELGVMINDEYPTLIDYLDGWVRSAEYNPIQKNKQLTLMAQMGYNFNYKGTVFTGFRIVRKNKKTEDFHRIVYSFLKYIGTEETIERLDEPIYAFILNHLFNNMQVMPYTLDMVLDSKYVTMFEHKSEENKFFRSLPLRTLYLFNQEIKKENLLI